MKIYEMIFIFLKNKNDNLLYKKKQKEVCG